MNTLSKLARLWPRRHVASFHTVVDLRIAYVTWSGHVAFNAGLCEIFLLPSQYAQFHNEAFPSFLIRYGYAALPAFLFRLKG